VFGEVYIDEWDGSSWIDGLCIGWSFLAHKVMQHREGRHMDALGLYGIVESGNQTVGHVAIQDAHIHGRFDSRNQALPKFH